MYVEKLDDDEEQVMYDSNYMILNKPYHVVWNGRDFWFMKTESGLEGYRNNPVGPKHEI